MKRLPTFGRVVSTAPLFSFLERWISPRRSESEAHFGNYGWYLFATNQ
jgi:hypothetical protein